MKRRYTGGCHCGEISLVFETEAPLAPRACQCSFCRKHNARTVSDPLGAAVVAREAVVGAASYRFASKAAGYIICPVCGVYVAAFARIGDAALATINLNAFDDPHGELIAEPVSYDGESAASKTARRAERWTPVELINIDTPPAKA